MLFGFGLTGRFPNPWPVIAQSLFVAAAGYAASFVLLKTRFPWIVSGIVCTITFKLIMVPYMIKNGTDWQSIAVDAIEWFAIGSITALVVMLVPEDWPKGRPDRTTYY